MRWWEYRCKLDAPWRPGECATILFRFNEAGDLEVRCRNCRRVQIVPRYAWDRQLVVST